MGYHRRATSHGRAFIGHVGADSFTLGDYPRGIDLGRWQYSKSRFRLTMSTLTVDSTPEGRLKGIPDQAPGVWPFALRREPHWSSHLCESCGRTGLCAAPSCSPQ